MDDYLVKLIRWLSLTIDLQYSRFVLITWLLSTFLLFGYILYGLLRIVSENERLHRFNEELVRKNRELER